MEKFAVYCTNKADLDKAVKKFMRMGAKWFGTFSITDYNWIYGFLPIWMAEKRGTSL